MKFTDLKLRPCLREEADEIIDADLPPSVRAQQDTQVINQISKRIEQIKQAKKKRKQLKAILAKVDAAVLGKH